MSPLSEDQVDRNGHRGRLRKRPDRTGRKQVRTLEMDDIQSEGNGGRDQTRQGESS